MMSALRDSDAWGHTVLATARREAVQVRAWKAIAKGSKKYGKALLKSITEASNGARLWAAAWRRTKGALRSHPRHIKTHFRLWPFKGASLMSTQRLTTTPGATNPLLTTSASTRRLPTKSLSQGPLSLSAHGGIIITTTKT